MRNVSLVLSSGGARGLAHIGVIEELESQGYRIRSIAGCSMGALVGGMYAAGCLAEFKEWMQTIDKRKMLSLIDLSLSINHLVKGERVIDALKEIVPDVNIEDLPIEYQAVATDWENGREVVFRSGSLYEAIRASISIPLFFNPVRRDGMILVDGGVLNPLPLKQGSQMSGELLVAVNVSGSYWGGEPKIKQLFEARRKHSRSLPMSILASLIPDGLDVNYFTLTQRMCCLMIQQNAALNIQLYKPDVVVDIPMNRFGSFEYDKVEKISKLGKTKMRKALLEQEGYMNRDSQEEIYE
ncbi:MAG: patatin-like phospholipase family protein [Bacteroidaceae bacterium]|nr:patatin-like phospholipase family protein [Bacteroidaceae bacterium]